MNVSLGKSLFLHLEDGDKISLSVPRFSLGPLNPETNEYDNEGYTFPLITVKRRSHGDSGAVMVRIQARKEDVELVWDESDPVCDHKETP